MRATPADGRTDRLSIVGFALVVLGLAAIVLRELGIDPLGTIAEAGWPLFVIVPGVALLAGAAIPEPPRGLGFAIAGSIVTSVGLVLWYQDLTGHWESWAYAWALVGPAGAGLGHLLYGGFTRDRALVGTGARLVAIGGGLFLAGAWFFETLFRSGRAPFDLGTWWPFVLLGTGIATVVSGFLAGRRGADTPIEPEGAPR